MNIVSLAVAWLLVFVSMPSHGFYSGVTPPAGFSTDSSGVRYGGAGATAPWAGGRVSAQVSINVGGRTIPLGVAARVAPSAAAVAVSAIRLSPASLAVGIGAQWLLTHGLRYANDQWQRQTTGGQVWYVPAGQYACAYSTGPYASAQAALDAVKVSFAMRYYYGHCNTVPPNITTGLNGCPTAQPNTYCDANVYVNGAGPRVTLQRAADVPPGWSAATETDFAPAAAPQTLPDELLNFLRPTVPLPVEVPSINPDAQGIPQPLRVPVGQPMPVPGTSPQAYRQPVVDLYPRVGYPWEIDVQQKDVETLDPIGVTQPQTISGSTPQGKPLERVDVITCGLPDTPPCKLQEAGTPTEAPLTSPKAVATQAATQLEQVINDAAAPASLPWLWGGFNLPAGACSNIEIEAPYIGISNRVLDLCGQPWVQWWRAALAWLCGLWTAFYAWRSFTETAGA